jgi:hypothetical protein
MPQGFIAWPNNTRGRVLVVAGAGVVVAVVVLAVAQLALPSIAIQRVRDRVGRYGPVTAVSVHAQPALELLWGDAESIEVHAGPLHMTPAQLVGLDASIGGVGSAELTAPQLDLELSGVASGVVPLQHARLTKRGSSLAVTGVVVSSALHAVLPAGFQAQGLYAESGRPEVGVSGEILTAHIGAKGLVSAVEGRIIVEPEIPFGALAAVTVFADPRVYVEAVSATARGEDVELTVRARRAG